jgi:AraC-like DNA-binding protein/tetratricopeptide (TPR) repeat protein
MNSDFVKKLTDIVEANLENEKFGVEDLVREMGISHISLHRKLKTSSNQTISQFIREIRLKKAKELLQNDDLTVSEIAYRVGFGSPTYFNNCFHEYYGYPPGVAKKQAIETDGIVNNIHPPESSEPVQQAEDKTMHNLPFYISFRKIFYAAIAIVAVFILVFSLFPRFGKKNDANKIVKNEIKSIAVLPVLNLTGNPEFQYIAEGIHTSLTDELYRLGNLLVRPTYSTMKFSESQLNVQEIAKELKVDIYIKPALLCSGDSFCVSVQLYQSVPEEKLLWSNTFSQEKSKVFGIFRNSALNIAEKINLHLTQQQKDYLIADQTINPDFFNALMRGRHLINKSNPEDFEMGVKELKKANDLNPLEPAPYLALAQGYANSGHASAAGADATKLSVAYAQKALELDSTIADAYVILATYYLYQEWDFKKAEKVLKRCIELNPNIAPARYHNGWFLALTGKFDQAAQEMIKAMDIDPLDPIIPGYLGWLYQYAERYEDAIAAAKRTIELDPDFVMGYYAMGVAYSGLGKHQEAIETHQKGIAISPVFLNGLGMAYASAGQRDKALEVAAKLEKKPNAWRAWGLSQIYATLGDKENTIRYIELMVKLRQDFVPWIKQDPSYKFIYKDPRFMAIVKSLNLPS